MRCNNHAIAQLRKKQTEQNTMGIPACMVHGGGCGAEAKELRHKMYYCTEAGGRANGPVCSPRLSLQMRLKLANSYEDMTITLHTSVILHCIFDYICYLALSCISFVILHFICYLAFHLVSCLLMRSQKRSQIHSLAVYKAYDPAHRWRHRTPHRSVVDETVICARQ